MKARIRIGATNLGGEIVSCERKSFLRMEETRGCYFYANEAAEGIWYYFGLTH